MLDPIEYPSGVWHVAPCARAASARAHARALLPGQRHGCHLLRMPKRFALESVDRPAAVVRARTCVFVCLFVCVFVRLGAAVRLAAPTVACAVERRNRSVVLYVVVLLHVVL